MLSFFKCLVFLLLTTPAFALTSTSPVTISGTVSVDGSAHTQPISGTIAVSGTTLVDGSAHTQPVDAGLPSTIGVITAHQRFTSTSTTSSQVVVSHTVNPGMPYYVLGYNIQAYYTTPSATASRMGDVNFDLGGASRGQHSPFNPTTSESWQVTVMFPEPIPVAAGGIVEITTTPASTTSTAWIGNIYGYEK